MHTLQRKQKFKKISFKTFCQSHAKPLLYQSPGSEVYLDFLAIVVTAFIT
jgi:hypothetical protein